MKELNTDFYDEYKRLDKFCRDMFSGQDGVTEYIKQMEMLPFTDIMFPHGTKI